MPDCTATTSYCSRATQTRGGCIGSAVLGLCSFFVSKSGNRESGVDASVASHSISVSASLDVTVASLGASHLPAASLFNPRRACAVRVTVLCLSVCLSATILALQATRRLMSDTNSFSATSARKITWRIFTIITGLPRPGLAHSAQRGRIKLLGGYISKSRAALHPLTITQLELAISELGLLPLVASE